MVLPVGKFTLVVKFTIAGIQPLIGKTVPVIGGL